MVPSLIHLALAAAIAGHAAAADPPDLATAFTAALVADDLRALHALAVSGRAGASFFRVVDVLDGRDRIAIASQRVVGAEWDDGVLVLPIFAALATHRAARRVASAPAR
jgi:hypothetical protein